MAIFTLTTKQVSLFAPIVPNLICLQFFKVDGSFLSLEFSDRENYFWHAGQNVRQAFTAMPDLLSPCQTFFPVDDWQISVAIFLFLVGHIMRIEPCWTKCPAGSDLFAGHHQKSAGHVRHVRHISRSLLEFDCGQTCGQTIILFPHKIKAPFSPP